MTHVCGNLGDSVAYFALLLSSHTAGSVLWVELCPPQISYIEVLCLVSQDMALFGNRVSVDIIS